MEDHILQLGNLKLLKNNRFLIFLSFFIFFSTLLLLTKTNISGRYLEILISLPFFLLITLNFRLTFTVFILSFFYETSIYYFSLPLLLVPIVIISFFINYTFKFSALKTPVWGYISIFLLSISPSYFISYKYIESWLLSYNIFAFITILLISIVTINDFSKIKKVIYLYLVGSIIGSILVILQAITSGKRAFGVSGVMFVDLVGVAIVISYSLFLFYVKRRMLFGLLTFLLVIALIFTQTRNSWISTSIVIISLTIHYIIKSKYFGLQRKKSIKRISAIFIGIGLVILSITILQPSVFKRVTDSKSQTTKEMAESIDDIGSLSTRFFIWHTAYNAFIENPVIGIGYFSFRFVSEEYNTWDAYIYNRFVSDLPPHTTVLAILAETGVVGSIGFLTFMYLMIRFARRNLKQSILLEHKIIAFIFFWSLIYICVSMVMTDAWLWGTLHMLWAVLLGMSETLRREIQSQNLLVLSSNPING